MPRVRWGSNLLLFCIPNVLLIIVFHNYQDDLDGFIWMCHIIVDWQNCFFSLDRNWSYIPTPLGWHMSLRWMMFRNILQAFTFLSCVSFNRVWIISFIIFSSLIRWSTKDNRLGIIILIWWVPSSMYCWCETLDGLLWIILDWIHLLIVEECLWY